MLSLMCATGDTVVLTGSLAAVATGSGGVAILCRRIVFAKSGYCQAEITVFGISPDIRARMPETAHLVRAHTLCPLCNIACAPICAQMTAKSHVCGGEDVRPMKGQDILAERNFALNAISRSPFSDENAIRKPIGCVMCCQLHTRNSSYSICECSATADRCLSDRPAALKHRIPFDRMQGFSAGTHGTFPRLQWQPAGHPMP